MTALSEEEVTTEDSRLLTRVLICIFVQVPGLPRCLLYILTFRAWWAYKDGYTFDVRRAWADALQRNVREWLDSNPGEPFLEARRLGVDGERIQEDVSCNSHFLSQF